MYFQIPIGLMVYQNFRVMPLQAHLHNPVHTPLLNLQKIYQHYAHNFQLDALRFFPMYQTQNEYCPYICLFRMLRVPR